MTSMNKAQRAGIEAAMQRAALHLIPENSSGGFVEAETQMDAHDHIQAAVLLCTRGNRRDLAEKLLTIAADLHRPGGPLAAALEALNEDPRPALSKRRRRKLAATISPGKSAVAKLVRRGACRGTA